VLFGLVTSGLLNKKAEFFAKIRTKLDDCEASKTERFIACSAHRAKSSNALASKVVEGRFQSVFGYFIESALKSGGCSGRFHTDTDARERRTVLINSGLK